MTYIRIDQKIDCQKNESANFSPKKALPMQESACLHYHCSYQKTPKRSANPPCEKTLGFTTPLWGAASVTFPLTFSSFPKFKYNPTLSDTIWIGFLATMEQK